MLDDLPAEFKVGIFKAARTFPAWIRFSNGSPRLQADSEGDGRGMAVKLTGVTESASTTQDFLMINHPVFLVRDDVLDPSRCSLPFQRQERSRLSAGKCGEALGRAASRFRLHGPTAEESGFVPVARITIPAREFRVPERLAGGR